MPIPKPFTSTNPYATDPTMPEPNPQDSARILLDLFGKSGTSTAPIELRGLREDRERELETNFANALPSRDPAANRYGALLKTLGQDIAEDPFTGMAPHARDTAEQDRQLALKNWMDPAEATKRHAQQNFELRKVLSAHPPQPGKADVWGNVTQAPGLMPSANPEAPISMGGMGTGRGTGAVDASGNRISSPATDQWTDPNTGKHITPTSTATDRAQRTREMTVDMPDVIAGMTEALLNYAVDFPKGTAVTKPEWQLALSRARDIDPNWSQAEYDKRRALQMAYEDKGAEKKNIDTLNTVMQHISRFDDAAKALKNWGPFPGSNFANAFTNYLGAKSGQAAPTNFELPANAVSEDLGSAFRALGATDAAVNRWRASLSRGSSPEQYDGAVKEMLGLLSGRLGQLQRSYETGMKLPFAPIRDKLLSPESKALLQRLDPHGEILEPGRVPGVPPPPGGYAPQHEQGQGQEQGSAATGPLPPTPDGRPRRRVRGGGIAVQDPDGQWYPE